MILGIDPGVKTDGTYINAGAQISSCGRYRYRLWREWRGFGSEDTWFAVGKRYACPMSCVFIMLNPSTADGEQDDPTIRRCVSFAKSWGYDRLDVINLFAHRATKPADLLALGHADDPVGYENQYHVTAACDHAGKIVFAWGAHGSHLSQDETMLGWLHVHDVFWCLGKTKSGHPRHPLYIPATYKPERYAARSSDLG